MKFIFNLLVLVFLAFLGIVGYQVFEKGKTVADSIDTVTKTISGAADEGKVELAKTLLKRDLKRKIKSQVFNSYGKVRCFLDTNYGTSCKIYNLRTDDIDANIVIYDIFSIIQIEETRSGIFDLDAKIRVDLNNTIIAGMDGFIDAVNIKGKYKRKAVEELTAVLNETPFIEVSVKTKKYNYDNVLANITITSGSKSLKVKTNITSKLGEVAIDSLKKLFIDKEVKQAREDSEIMLSDIYIKKVKLAVSVPENFMPKASFFMSNVDKSVSFNSWKGSFDNEKNSTKYNLQILLKKNNHLIDELVEFIHGKSSKIMLTLDAGNNNLDLNSILKKRVSLEDFTIR